MTATTLNLVRLIGAHLGTGYNWDLSKNLLKKHEARYLDRPAGSKQAMPMLIRMEQA